MKRTIIAYIPFIIVALLFLCAGGGQISQAQVAATPDKLKQIPRFDKMSPAEFEEQTILFHDIPYEDAELEYSIRLPKGWQKVGENKSVAKENKSGELSNPYDISNLRDEKLSDESKKNKKNAGIKDEEDEKKEVKQEGIKSSFLGSAAKYAGPSNMDATSSMDILAVKLSQDISIKNWLMNHIITNNYSILGMEQVSPERVESLHVMLVRGITYYVRSAAIANGDRVVLVSYTVPEQYWEKERELQQLSLSSFAFLHPGESAVKDKKTYTFMDLAKFEYPASWRFSSPNQSSVDMMSVKIIFSPDGRILDGEIDVKLISTEVDTTLIKEVETVRNSLKERKIDVGDLIETRTDYKFGDYINFSRVEVYKVNSDKDSRLDYEYWLAIMVEDRYYYIVTMITPGRTQDFYMWARNSEIFAEVIESLGPINDNLRSKTLSAAGEDDESKKAAKKSKLSARQKHGMAEWVAEDEIQQIESDKEQE